MADTPATPAQAAAIAWARGQQTLPGGWIPRRHNSPGGTPSCATLDALVRRGVMESGIHRGPRGGSCPSYRLVGESSPCP